MSRVISRSAASITRLIWSSAGRAPFAINITGGKLATWTNSSDHLDGDGVGVIQGRYLSPAKLPENTWINFVARMKCDESGELQVWRDGVQVVDLNIPIGYFDDASPTEYWQDGVYTGDVNHPDIVDHAAMAAAKTIVEFANVAWGTTDLTDRILNPLPI